MLTRPEMAVVFVLVETTRLGNGDVDGEMKSYGFATDEHL